MIRVSEPCIGDHELDYVSRALLNKELTQGLWVKRFEKRFSERLSVDHAVACSSGTTALHLVLAAMGLGPGDEVLVPDLTFVATANAVRYCGATPVLVDIHPTSWCMDPLDARFKITDRTKAIIAVHLYGIPADMTALMALGLPVVEDAAEGLGGSLNGRALGTLGLAGTFSFYGNKVLTTGEGGCVVTNNGPLAMRMRHLRGQAMDANRRYYHDELGFNYRMTDVQAALGCGQLDHLSRLLEDRRRLFRQYHRRLGLQTVPRVENISTCEQAPWLFTFQHPMRDRLMAHLTACQIETRPTFVPLHELPMYQSCGFPHAWQAGRYGISLPTHPGLTTHDVNRICDEVQYA